MISAYFTSVDKCNCMKRKSKSCWNKVNIIEYTKITVSNTLDQLLPMIVIHEI